MPLLMASVIFRCSPAPSFQSLPRKKEQKYLLFWLSVVLVIAEYFNRYSSDSIKLIKMMRLLLGRITFSCCMDGCGLLLQM